MRAGAALSALALVAGCQAAAQGPTAALTLSPEKLAHRQVEMRRFDTKDEATMLAASTGVLQDLGFTIEESNAHSGLVVGAKDRDAVETGQVAAQLMMVALVAALGGKSANPVWDNTQKIRVSVVTTPSADKAATVVHVTFQRVVWNNYNQVSRMETIDDPEIHRQFFERLSKAAFLEAHQL